MLPRVIQLKGVDGTRHMFLDPNMGGPGWGEAVYLCMDVRSRTSAAINAIIEFSAQTLN